jgi:type II secretory pathway pseudopilin PulG
MPGNRQSITPEGFGAALRRADNCAVRRARSVAFTLVEMIVVILIIATLTALFVGAAANTFDRARKTQAKNDVTQIATAVNAFFTEYGRYPVQLTDNNDAFFGPAAAVLPAGWTRYGDNDVLFDVLRNNTDPAGPNLAKVTSLNPRQIVFISPGGAKNTNPPRGGIVATGQPSARQYFDPWGSEYVVVIDTSYDNTLTNPYADVDGSAGTSPIRQGVIAYSYGKSGTLGGGAKLNASFGDESGAAGTFKGSSDILSW